MTINAEISGQIRADATLHLCRDGNMWASADIKVEGEPRYMSRVEVKVFGLPALELWNCKHDDWVTVAGQLSIPESASQSHNGKYIYGWEMMASSLKVHPNTQRFDDEIPF